MIGVIDVGGGMRAAYGAGVFDWCMDNGIKFDYCVGISAGSANVVSYLAGQRGRNYVFYTEYDMRDECMSFKNFVKTRNFVDLEYAYGKLSNEGFVSKAPAKLVEEERAKQAKYEEMLAKVVDRLAIVEKKVAK